MSEQEGHSPERANAMSDKASKVMVRSSAFTHRRVVARSLEGMSRRVMLPGLCFFFFFKQFLGLLLFVEYLVAL